MKFFVLGCNGMVGHVVTLYLKEHGHDVLGYDEKKTKIFNCIYGSYKNINRVKNIILYDKFDSIINCTAIINQFAENDKAEATYLNSYFPHLLEKITCETPVIVVHRSTDCIFSGSRGSYKIDDIPDASNFYARTKAVGELNNKKDITIRTSLVGPELDSKGVGLLNWFVNQQKEVDGYANSIWTGLTTIEFAKEIEYLVSKKAHGLFQCVPNKSISKYELLNLFLEIIPGNKKVKYVDNKKNDKSLIQEIGEYGLKIPDYNIMMKDMKEWIQCHKSLYSKSYYSQGEDF